MIVFSFNSFRFMDDLSALLARFAGVHVSSKDEALQKLSNLLNLPQEQSFFYLEASGFDLERAVNLFFNDQQQQVIGGSVMFPLEDVDHAMDSEEDGEQMDPELQAALAASMESHVTHAEPPFPHTTSPNTMNDDSNDFSKSSTFGFSPPSFVCENSSTAGPLGVSSTNLEAPLVFGSGSTPMLSFGSGVAQGGFNFCASQLPQQQQQQQPK